MLWKFRLAQPAFTTLHHIYILTFAQRMSTIKSYYKLNNFFCFFYVAVSISTPPESGTAGTELQEQNCTDS